MLAIRAKSEAAPLLSRNAPASANCCRHPAPCFVNCEVSLRRHLITAALFIVSSALHAATFHDTAVVSSLVLASSQMDPTLHSSRVLHAEHHLTCNGKKKFLNSLNPPPPPEVDCKPLFVLQPSVSCGLLSTFPVRTVTKRLVRCHRELETCQQNPQSFIYASTAMWHRAHT